MIKVFFILYRLAIVAVLGAGSLLYFRELFYICAIMMVLFLLVAYGLWSHRRWTMAPIVVVMIFLTLVTAAMTVGNIAWPEHLIIGIGLAYVVLMILEGATLAFIVSEDRKITVDSGVKSHTVKVEPDDELLSPSESSS
jgi:hypothetical protein